MTQANFSYAACPETSILSAISMFLDASELRARLLRGSNPGREPVISLTDFMSFWDRFRRTPKGEEDLTEKKRRRWFGGGGHIGGGFAGSGTTSNPNPGGGAGNPNPGGGHHHGGFGGHHHGGIGGHGHGGGIGG